MNRYKEFKVGDEVRFKKNQSNKHLKELNSTYKIIEITHSFGDIYFHLDKIWGGYYPHRFKKVSRGIII